MAAYQEADLQLDSSIVVIRRFFHDDWFKITRALQTHISTLCTLNPFTTDKALLRCENRELLFSCKNLNFEFFAGVHKFLSLFYLHQLTLECMHVEEDDIRT